MIASVLAAQEMAMTFGERALATAIGAGFGAFVGALLAFGLALWRQKRDERRERVEKLRSALFTLVMQRSRLRNYWDQALKPLLNDPNRSVMLRPTLFAPHLERSDFNSLAFLLGFEGGEFLNMLVVAQEKYGGVLALIESRNALHERFQQKLEASGATEGTVEDMESELRGIVGPMIMKALKDQTDALYEFVEDANSFNAKTCEAAAAIFRRVFPKEELFGFEDLQITAGSADFARNGNP